jgi:hypothetical protein
MRKRGTNKHYVYTTPSRASVEKARNRLRERTYRSTLNGHLDELIQLEPVSAGVGELLSAPGVQSDGRQRDRTDVDDVIMGCAQPAGSTGTTSAGAAVSPNDARVYSLPYGPSRSTSAGTQSPQPRRSPPTPAPCSTDYPRSPRRGTKPVQLKSEAALQAVGRRPEVDREVDGESSCVNA